jgi:hypothetical protein
MTRGASSDAGLGAKGLVRQNADASGHKHQAEYLRVENRVFEPREVWLRRNALAEIAVRRLPCPSSCGFLK